MKRIGLVVLLFAAVSLLLAGTARAIEAKRVGTTNVDTMKFDTLIIAPCSEAIMSYVNAKKAFDRCWNLKGLDAIKKMPADETPSCHHLRKGSIAAYAEDHDINLPPGEISSSTISFVTSEIQNCDDRNFDNMGLFKYQACSKCPANDKQLQNNGIDCENIFN